jgi:hypothetical protein
MSQDSGSRVVIIVVVLVALAGGGYLWWRKQQAAPPPPPPPQATQAPAPAPSPPPDAAAAPVIRHPIAPPKAGPLPSLDESDAYVKDALTGLVGRKGLAFLILESFIRKSVSTVDNLAREHASAEHWPVKPTPGRFEVEVREPITVISARNAARYAAFVRFVEAVDTRAAVGLYVRLYPLFQQAYADLGYPQAYFNDRLVEVIDHLLETPDPGATLEVTRIVVEGADPSRPPLYKYTDPAFETRSAGQKILLRMGRDNADRLKGKLSAIRRQIARTEARGDLPSK